MTIRIGINGFGRIGRLVFGVAAGRNDVEIAGINDLASPADLAQLLKYDSVHGRFPGVVGANEDGLVVGGRSILVTGEKDPAALPWKDLGVQMAVESTGVFHKREQIARHLRAGLQKVLLSVPAKDALDATTVLAGNDTGEYETGLIDPVTNSRGGICSSHQTLITEDTRRTIGYLELIHSVISSASSTGGICDSHGTLINTVFITGVAKAEAISIRRCNLESLGRMPVNPSLPIRLRAARTGFT